MTLDIAPGGYGLDSLTFCFYLHPEGQKPPILAVLHENMHLLSRLASCLAA